MSGPVCLSVRATAWCRWTIRTPRTNGAARFWMGCRIVIEAQLSSRPACGARERSNEPHARNCRLQPAQRLRWLAGERRNGGLLAPALLQPVNEVSAPLLDGMAAQRLHHCFPPHLALGERHRGCDRDCARHAVDVVRIDEQRRL